MRQEEKWLNVLKCLAIIVIYMGAIGGEFRAGYIFISTHYIALFFFTLGLAENLYCEENIVKYLINKIKTVLIPCYVLACLVVIMITIQYDFGWDSVADMNIIMAKGFIRNTFVADSLWYLTCLFSMQMMFFFIKKVRYKWLIFGICIVLHYGNIVWMNSVDFSHWYFNVDAALYYMIFYAAGYLSFPYVTKLFELDTKKRKILFIVSGGISLFYSIALYFGIDVLSYVIPSFAWKFVFAIKAGIIIWTYVVCARCLKNVKFFENVGEEIVYLCGSYYLVSVIIGTVLSILGRTVVMVVPVRAYMYMAIMLFLGVKYIVPVEKYIVNKIVKKF